MMFAPHRKHIYESTWPVHISLKTCVWTSMACYGDSFIFLWRWCSYLTGNISIPLHDLLRDSLYFLVCRITILAGEGFAGSARHPRYVATPEKCDRERDIVLTKPLAIQLMRTKRNFTSLDFRSWIGSTRTNDMDSLRKEITTINKNFCEELIGHFPFTVIWVSESTNRKKTSVRMRIDANKTSWEDVMFVLLMHTVETASDDVTLSFMKIRPGIQVILRWLSWQSEMMQCWYY
jgi:hypothetical protein